jgi:hypothetical protein
MLITLHIAIIPLPMLLLWKMVQHYQPLLHFIRLIELSLTNLMIMVMLVLIISELEPL